MLAVLSDTHSNDGHELRGPTLDAVQSADRVVHAGDFTSGAALDGFYGASEHLVAVHGNGDDDAVTGRLPAARTFEVDGVRIAVTHTRHGGTTGLSMFGREREADLVVFGHTHRPAVLETRGMTLLNPGSHTDPRGGEAAYAELRTADGGELRGRILTTGGSVLREFRVEGR